MRDKSLELNVNWIDETVSLLHKRKQRKLCLSQENILSAETF